MVIKFVIFGLIILIYFIYIMYFKDYFNVKKIFLSLKNFLNTRDTFVLKIIPEVKDKKKASKVVKLIEERQMNFNSSYNNAIKSDAILNGELKKLYELVNAQKSNELTKQVFSKIMNMERELKKIRDNYNLAVEKYNNNLVKHKFICLKIIRMKPLDTYKTKV